MTVRRLAAVLVLATVVAACSNDEPAVIGRDGSVVVDDVDVELRAEPLDAYRITYRVQQRDGDDVVETEATLVVDRPFRARFESGTTLRVADLGYFGAKEAGDETEVVTAVPAPAPGDVRADVLALGPAVETREVAGRACRVHRSGASLLDGLVVEGSSVESCIDGDGLVLEEVVTVDGAIVTRRVATDVDSAPDLDDVSFAIDGVAPRSPDDGGGSIQEIEPTSAPPGITFYELPSPPAGFSLLGRYAVVPPQEARLDDEETRARYLASVVEVWTRGGDVLVIDQGGTLGQVPPFGADPHGEAVTDLGEVGVQGEVVHRTYGADVRVLLPPGRYVKVSGTLPVDDLLAITRSLRGVEGTGLVYR